MVEAFSPSMSELGLTPDGNIPEKNIPAVERGRQFIENQLESLRASGDVEKWKDTFNQGLLNLKFKTTLKFLEIQSVLDGSPIGAQIDSFDDALAIVVVFAALPALNKAYGLGKRLLQKEAA